MGVELGKMNKPSFSCRGRVGVVANVVRSGGSRLKHGGVRWDVGDGALVEVDVKAEEVNIINWFAVRLGCQRSPGG